MGLFAEISNVIVFFLFGSNPLLSYMSNTKFSQSVSVERLLVDLSKIVRVASDCWTFGSSISAFHKATTVRGWASCSLTKEPHQETIKSAPVQMFYLLKERLQNQSPKISFTGSKKQILYNWEKVWKLNININSQQMESQCQQRKLISINLCTCNEE